MNPFELASAIASNTLGAQRNVTDRREISDILNQAQGYTQPQQYQGAIANILANVSPEGRQGAFSALESSRGLQQEQRKQSQQDQQRQKQGDFFESKGLSRDLAYASEGVQRQEISGLNQEKKPGALQLNYEKKVAEQYSSDKTEVQKLSSSISDLDRLSELSEGPLSGITGYLKALGGSEAANEFDTLAFTALAPVLKIFNPVGALPTQKVKILEQKFTPKATEPSWVINGKLNTLQRIASQAKQRAEERIKYVESFGGEAPPFGALEKFDNETTKIAENLIDAEAKKISNLQDSKQSKNLKSEKTSLTDIWK